MGKQIFYRGALTSCNYACSYCPFSKRTMTKAQRSKDETALWKFVEARKLETEKHAVQIVPYGEALIHEYYWRALAELSRIEAEEYTGCQTNLSFSVENMLKVYEEHQGRKEKLRLWCTFHPSMTSVEAFVEQCHKLQLAGISFWLEWWEIQRKFPFFWNFGKNFQLPFISGSTRWMVEENHIPRRKWKCSKA